MLVVIYLAIAVGFGMHAHREEGLPVFTAICEGALWPVAIGFLIGVHIKRAEDSGEL